MKRIILLTSLSFIMGIGVVMTLIATSGVVQKSHHSFVRYLPPHPALEGDTIGLPYNSYYLAGGTASTAYLGNLTAPLHVLQINLATLDTQRVRLTIDGIDKRKFWSLRLQVDSPYFYLTDGAVPVIYKGNVQDWKGEEFLIDSIFFRTIVPINGNSFLIKSLSGSNENSLGKLSAGDPHYEVRAGILEKQVDGIFCTDGMQLYNRASNRSVYLYYYRNQFTVMDSSLSIIYRAKTLDTTSVARIQPVVIEGTATLGSPPTIVNYSSDMNENFLFVHSRSLARNEPADAFDHGYIIDVYTLSDGQYRLSFYVYHFGRKRMIQFRVFGNTMVVLYEKVFRVFHLQPSYFSADVYSP